VQVGQTLPELSRSEISLVQGLPPDRLIGPIDDPSSDCHPYGLLTAAASVQ
jgi:hypothetical protein